MPFFFKDSLQYLYDDISLGNNRAVKITLSVSNFSYINHKTLSLLALDEDMHYHHISKSIQELRDRYGLDILKTGNEL